MNTTASTAAVVKLSSNVSEFGDDAEYIVYVNGINVGRVWRRSETGSGYYGAWAGRSNYSRSAYSSTIYDDTRKNAVAELVRLYALWAGEFYSETH